MLISLPAIYKVLSCENCGMLCRLLYDTSKYLRFVKLVDRSGGKKDIRLWAKLKVFKEGKGKDGT